MEIRLLGPGDEALLIEAADIFNETAMKSDAAAALLADPTFVIVIARDESGKMMGRIYGHELRRLDQTDLFLYEADVSDRYQRRGAGLEMLKRLRTLCVERRYGEMFVLTELSNEEGNGLYSAAGGVTEGSPANIYVFPTPDA